MCEAGAFARLFQSPVVKRLNAVISMLESGGE
jgi:hypothetical protein